MLKLILILAALTAINATAILNHHNDISFEDWVDQHGREYASAEMASVARATFESNKQLIKQLQAEEPNVEFRLNHFADMDPKTFAEKVLMPKRPTPTFSENRKLQLPQNAGPAPDAFDWRQHGAVTPVKDQGSVGSCWAFSTTGNIEGQWFLANNTLVGLSEEQIVECDSTQDPKSQAADCGVFGGWPYLAMEYVIHAGGVESETSYPYCVGTGACFPCMAPGYNKTRCGPPVEYCNATKWSCHQSASADAARIRDWAYIPPDEEGIKTALFAHGPLSVALDAMSLQFYHSGIWNGHFCSKTSLDHAVLLVGYGSSKSILGKEEPYWIVKNSWSTKWGESGYFRIARGSGTCGINTQVVTAIV